MVLKNVSMVPNAELTCCSSVDTSYPPSTDFANFAILMLIGESDFGAAAKCLICYFAIKSFTEACKTYVRLQGYASRTVFFQATIIPFIVLMRLEHETTVLFMEFRVEVVHIEWVRKLFKYGLRNFSFFIKSVPFKYVLQQVLSLATSSPLCRQYLCTAHRSTGLPIKQRKSKIEMCPFVDRTENNLSSMDFTCHEAQVYR